MTNRRILVIHPDLYAFGGAELVSAHLIAALQDRAEISLIHVGRELDPERIRAWSGIELDPGRVRFITAGMLGRWLAKRPRLALLKYAIAVRYARRLERRFELVVSSYAECPIDRPGVIQYIHIPMFSIKPEILQYLGLRRMNRWTYWIRLAYVQLCKSVAGWNKKAVERHKTIANSQWTADVFGRVYDAPKACCVFPPVSSGILPADTRWVKFENRNSNFVMLGRIHPAKRIELGVQIIEKLRNRGHQVHLHIAGVARDKYINRLRKMIDDRDYVHIHLNMDKTDLESLVISQKYGLHCTQFEHFGLAAAEMQALGCLVFVPDYSGQREVIPSCMQRYKDADDAVAKIDAVINSTMLRGQLLEEAERASKRLSVSRFANEIRSVVSATQGG